MKFILTIWVCSFLGNPAVCLAPLEHPKQFNSWYECSRTAHKESIKIYSKLGYKYVNDNKIATRYSCKKVSSI
tara:strand:+ start:133 stop:351 length:219 start_codon:yes stop_codon:yes gene_type:complete